MISVCAQCGAEFSAIAYQLKHGRRFCSHACSSKSIRKDTVASFHDKFLRGHPDACWNWTGAKTFGGYGVVWDRPSRKLIRANRLSYTIHVGPIPDGMGICHTCDNPPCVNPAHLFVGTPKENAADKVRKGRQKGGGMSGEKNARSVLTDQDVLLIRTLLGPALEIGKQFGVAETTVLNIRHRRTWRHLP